MHAAFVVNARTEHIKGSKGLYSLALNLNFLHWDSFTIQVNKFIFINIQCFKLFIFFRRTDFN